jgi:hypothetical protein
LFYLGGYLKRGEVEEGLGPSIPDKLYYKIGEVSRITGVKPHVLRYWESEFREIKPYKSRSIKDSPDKAKQMELQFDKKTFKRIFMEIKRELKAITQSLE